MMRDLHVWPPYDELIKDMNPSKWLNISDLWSECLEIGTCLKCLSPNIVHNQLNSRQTYASKIIILIPVQEPDGELATPDRCSNNAMSCCSLFTQESVWNYKGNKNDLQHKEAKRPPSYPLHRMGDGDGVLHKWGIGSRNGMRKAMGANVDERFFQGILKPLPVGRGYFVKFAVANQALPVESNLPGRSLSQTRGGRTTLITDALITFPLRWPWAMNL